MKLYRYEREKWHENLLDNGVELKEYDVIRETPKCYVIKKYSSGMDETFVLKEGKKAFAYDTKEKALSGFIHRTARALKLQDYQHRASLHFLGVAKRILEASTTPTI